MKQLLTTLTFALATLVAVSASAQDPLANSQATAWADSNAVYDEVQTEVYDDDNVELYIVDENVLVRDLNSDATKLVRFKNLSTYLQRAKDT